MIRINENRNRTKTFQLIIVFTLTNKFRICKSNSNVMYFFHSLSPSLLNHRSPGRHRERALICNGNSIVIKIRPTRSCLMNTRSIRFVLHTLIPLQMITSPGKYNIIRPNMLLMMPIDEERQNTSYLSSIYYYIPI